MNLSLRPITRENYETISELEVSEDQENYVAGNTWTLLEAAYNPDYVVRAIYLGPVTTNFVSAVER